ncbi:hypothetical protein RIF29_14784 [Crotalaria pallida]|uniref:Uncharacterized protein n=1 Tax=Crotalaria pallida TaxID=3830 RepID=A0AAN9FE19_CROPI
MKEVGRPNLADCFPVLKIVDPHGIRRRTGNYFWKLLNIFKRLVKERLELRKETGYSTRNDMLDSMLNAQENNQNMYKDMIERLSVVRISSLVRFYCRIPLSPVLSWAEKGSKTK